MNLVNLSTLIIPFLVALIVIYAIYKKINVYDVFISGAKDGIEMGISIFPYLLAMIVAINVLLKSHIIEDFLVLLKPVLSCIKIPMPVIPMAIMRPISGSSTLILMNDIYVNYGVDSFLGKLASTIQGSTDTTIYILTLYFGFVGIKKIKYAMWVGLFADLIGVIASILVVSWLF
ncbi:MAG: spore maturation protein [Bacilli bacterium]|nr:spore maturation protein [Bacilli bacterium]